MSSSITTMPESSPLTTTTPKMAPASPLTTTTPKMAPASRPSDENGASLSFDEAKTQFLHVIAKLKPLHVSMFFHWLQLQINTYTLNGSVLHGLPSTSLSGSTSSSTSSTILATNPSSSSSSSSSLTASSSTLFATNPSSSSSSSSLTASSSSTLFATNPSCSSSSSSSLTALSLSSTGSSSLSSAFTSTAQSSLSASSSSSPKRTLPSVSPVCLPDANDPKTSSPSSSLTTSTTTSDVVKSLVAEMVGRQQLKMNAHVYPPSSSGVGTFAASRGVFELLGSHKRHPLDENITIESSFPPQPNSLDPESCIDSSNRFSPDQTASEPQMYRPMSVPPFHRPTSFTSSHRPVSVPPYGCPALASRPSHVTAKSPNDDLLTVNSCALYANNSPCSSSATALQTGVRLQTSTLPSATSALVLSVIPSTTSSGASTANTNLSTLRVPTFTSAGQRLPISTQLPVSMATLPVSMTTRAHSTEVTRNLSTSAACPSPLVAQHYFSTSPSPNAKTTALPPPPASPAIIGSDALFHNIGNAQQHIQQLLRHQQMLGSQSILRTHLQYYQMHHLHQLYDPSSMGVNGLLPPPFPSLLPSPGVPIASAALARQLGVAPTTLLTSSSPLIAVSTPVSNGSSPAPPPISPALSSPIPSISDSSLITTTSINNNNNNIILTRDPIIAKMPHLKRETQIESESKHSIHVYHSQEQKNSIKPKSGCESLSPAPAVVKVESETNKSHDSLTTNIVIDRISSTSFGDRIPLETIKRDSDLETNIDHIKCQKMPEKKSPKHKTKHKNDRKRRREKRHKDRNRSKSCSSSVSSSTSDGGSEVGVSPIKRKFKMSPRHSSDSCNDEFSPAAAATSAATAAAPFASVKKHLTLRDSGNYDDENDDDDVGKGDANSLIGTEGGNSFLAKDKLTTVRDSGSGAEAPVAKNGAHVPDEDDYEEGELVITEDAPVVEDRFSDEDDEVVDVDSVDDVDPRDRSLILKLNAAMEGNDAAALSRTLTTVDDRKCIVEYSLAHGEDAAQVKFGVHRKMIARWKKEVEVMNAVNPTLRTRYYKELTRRRKRWNGDADADDDDDFEDDIDGLGRDESLPQDLVTKSAGRSREDDLDEGVEASSSSRVVVSGDCVGLALPESASSRSGDDPSGAVFTSQSSSSSSSSSLSRSKLNRLDDAAFDDGGVGLSMESGGVFLGGDALGAMDLECLAEAGSGGGTKMYTPAQKKAIVEYAVQYGERAAAKKFGVHRKNIYRWKRNHNLMAKTSIKRPSGPRLSLGGDPADIVGDLASSSTSSALDIPPPALISATGLTAPASIATTSAIAIGGGWVFPSPITAQHHQQTDRHLIAPPLPPLLPPPHLRPEQNTLTIEVIKTNSAAALSPALQGHYLNFYNSHCNVRRASPSTPPPPPSSPFVPPLPPPPPPLTHHLATQLGLKPQLPNSSAINDSIIPKNINNNNSELWESLKDVKPDLRTLSEQVSWERRRGTEEDYNNERFRKSPFPTEETLVKQQKGELINLARCDAREGHNKSVATSTGVLNSHCVAASSEGLSTASSDLPLGPADSDLACEPTDLRQKKRKRKNSGRTV